MMGHMSDLAEQLPDVPTLLAELDSVSYLADEPLGTALFLAARMSQPILLEGEPGVGKTEAAKALAAVLDTPMIRLQCYEGLTSSEALYEWNYPRQLLAIRLAEARGEAPREADLFSDDYLLERPLLAALDHPGPRPAVLLIDEVDRGDDEFEAFLFELLAESAVTIPELGTRRAAFPAGRRADLQPDPRPARRAQAALPVSLDRLPGRRAGRRDHQAAGARGQRAAGRRRWRAACTGCAASTWLSRRESPRRSAGRTPCRYSAQPSWTQAAARQTMGTVLKYAEDLQAARAADFAAVVGHGGGDG